MQQKKHLLALAIGAAGVVSSLDAAQPVSLQKISLPELQQTFTLVLPSLQTSATVSNSQDALQFVKQHIDVNKITHARMQQTYAGFPVFGGYAILHSPKSMQMLSATKVKMTGNVYRGLDAELGQPPSAFKERAELALKQFKTAFQDNAVADEKVTPIVYIDEKNKALWAYKVSFFVAHRDKIPERPTAIVDAETFKPLLKWNALKTARSSIKGVGFGGNPRLGQYHFGNDFPSLPLTRTDTSSTCYMENNDVKVVDMGHKYTSTNNAMKFKCEPSDMLPEGSYWTGYKSDGYDVENGAYSPSNDAMYAGQVIKDMYKEWYGLDVLTKNKLPMQLVLRVHFGDGYENAYWDGQQMTFGDGNEEMYPLVSLGIGAHEISHGFTEQHADLEYVGQSGGINEAFSDMAAQAAEYYSQGKSSWMIASEVMKEQSGYTALRFMDVPSRDGKSIDRADQYTRNLDVHYASGVYNRLFYLLSTQPQWNVKQAFAVMVKANMDYWTPYSTYVEGACGIINAATDLKLPVDDVQAVLNRVAINYSKCQA